MFPDLPSAISSLEVTITPTMIVVGVLVAYVVQLFKALTAGWSKLTEAIRKPLWPLTGIALASLVFCFAEVPNWLVAGTIMGLSAGGGYDLFKGTSGLNHQSSIEKGD